MGLHEGVWALEMRNWRVGGERSVHCMVCQVGCPQVPQMGFVLGVGWEHGGWEQVIPVLWPL